MNRQRAKELLPIIEAFANGEAIQFRGPTMAAWDDCLLEDSNIGFRDDVEYRVVPKPRTLWLDSLDGEVFIQETSPMVNDYRLTKWREVLEDDNA